MNATAWRVYVLSVMGDVTGVVNDAVRARVDGTSSSQFSSFPFYRLNLEHLSGNAADAFLSQQGWDNSMQLPSRICGREWSSVAGACELDPSVTTSTWTPPLHWSASQAASVMSDPIDLVFLSEAWSGSPISSLSPFSAKGTISGADGKRRVSAGIVLSVDSPLAAGSLSY